LFRTVCGAGLLEAPQKLAISRVAKPAITFRCIFKFASSRKQPDTFSLKRNEMEGGNIPPLDDNDPSRH
jgi:hypothetical protein